MADSANDFRFDFFDNKKGAADDKPVWKTKEWFSRDDEEDDVGQRNSRKRYRSRSRSRSPMVRRFRSPGLKRSPRIGKVRSPKVRHSKSRSPSPRGYHRDRKRTYSTEDSDSDSSFPSEKKRKHKRKDKHKRKHKRSKKHKKKKKKSHKHSRHRHKRHRARSPSSVASSYSSESSDAYLEKPRPKSACIDYVASGVGKEQGLRPYMEDRSTLEDIPVSNDSSIFFGAVYDGHGGSDAASFAMENLHETFSEKLLPKKDGSVDDEAVMLALEKAFEATEKGFMQVARIKGLRCGSTAAVSVVCPGKNPKLVTGNLGDSRVVMSRAGEGVRVTVDQTPELPNEKSRIEANGGKVCFMGCWRVCHEEIPIALACARSLGDFPLKFPHKLVSAEPDLRSFDLKSTDEFIIIASDGLWDVIDDQTAVDIVRDSLSKNFLSKKSMRDACKLAAQRLVDVSMKCKTEDNVTVAIQLLNWKKEEPSSSSSGSKA